jgi:hypothetical protein
MPNIPNLVDLELCEIHSTLINDIVKQMKAKSSMGAVGLSMTLVKQVVN